jgi:Protein of unknown function (DUF2283)
MKLTVDPEADALYLRLNDAEIIDSEQVASVRDFGLRRARQPGRRRNAASFKARAKS